MDTVKFLEWLSAEKSMGARSAKDIVSRCSRVNRLLGIEELGVDTIELPFSFTITKTADITERSSD